VETSLDLRPQHIAARAEGLVANQFRSGRQFAAWLGLTPLQHSSGRKERLGRISKMGDKYLRRLLVVGMTSLVRRAEYKPEAVDPWLFRASFRDSHASSPGSASWLRMS
jgi:transposase